MDLGLKGKVALVTGASRGIGAAIAQRFDQEGCKVAVLARRQSELDGLVAGFSGPHAKEALALACDMMSADQIEKSVTAILKQFGRVDIAVNNVGGAEGFNAFHEISDDQYRRTWELNFLSAVRVARLVLPKMLEQKWGRIINISSESGTQPDPIGVDYACSKGALNTLTKSLSKAYAAQGVLTNTVSPAFVMTPLLRYFVQRAAAAQSVSFEEAQMGMLNGFRPHIEVKRPGTSEEVASTVAFVASDLAGFINGANVRVDGGSVASV